MEEMVEKILSKIGSPVEFTYPEGDIYKGVLKDRVVISAPTWTEKDVPYFDTVDLIQFRVPQEFTVLRFGYYRVKNGKLGWAAQTTLTEPLETWKELFVKAVKEKHWFRDFLIDVLREALG